VSRIATRPTLQPELFSYSFPVRVYYENTDAGGVVYHAEYLRFLERARTEWLRHLGFDHQGLARDHRVSLVVTALAVDFVKPARLDETIFVGVQLESLGKARCVFAQEIRREDELLVRAKVTVACVAFESMKPAEIPEALRRKMEAAT
jgi:tol-pal system-associated acyl-CoA thioesterase